MKIRVEQESRFWWWAFVVRESEGTDEGMGTEVGPFCGFTCLQAVNRARRYVKRVQRREASQRVFDA